MTTLVNNAQVEYTGTTFETRFYVIHPLDDQPEEKRATEHLGRMHLSPMAKISLLSLRFYLITMIGLVAYRALHELNIL